MNHAATSRAPAVVGLLFVILGLGVGGGGAWLVFLGGSWYYLAAGLLMLLTGLLLYRRRPAALNIFAALFAGTLAWALWEAGLDWWPLAARLGLLFLLGLLLLMPWVTRALGPSLPSRASRFSDSESARHATQRTPEPSALWRRGAGLVLGVFVLVALASWTSDPHAIEGTLATTQDLPPAAADPVPAGEWHAYGRTGYGQRYSPLAQITPTNVGDLTVAWQFRTGDMRGQPGDPVETTYEVTPLKIANQLYLCNPHQSVIALACLTSRRPARPRLQ